MPVREGPPVLRIGELSRRVGVSGHVLRAWESRYGLLRPARSAGGYRLYAEADASRVRQMQAQLARGLSAAEAARSVLDEAAAPGPGPRAASGELSGALRKALDAFDEAAAQAVLDRLMSGLSLTTVLRDVVLPYLAELGDRWERGTASIAQEHFASNVIRGRLAGLARGWGHGHGPRAVLACPPGERHDLALMAFGIVLNRTGWQIVYLGADTPIAELTRTAAARQPGLVVLAATRAEAFEPHTARPRRPGPDRTAHPGRSRRHASARGGDRSTAARRRPRHRRRTDPVAEMSTPIGPKGTVRLGCRSGVPGRPAHRALAGLVSAA